MTGGIKPAKKPSRQEADGEDRISVLPDAVLQHALGFLPSRDAVRTCVLGRRWGNLWRALPRLRITNVPALGSDDRLDLFVNQLLLLRDPGSTLDECEINLSRLGDRPCPRYVDLWVRHALLLRARVMRLCFNLENGALCDQHRPLVSTFLKVLYIDGMRSDIPYVMDFSRCPALEDVEITSSNFMAGCKFISPSAKRLCFVKCAFGANEYPDDRSSISAQSLIWLKIEKFKGLAPVLGCMPSLQAASIWVRCALEHRCEKPCSAGSCCDQQCLNCDEDLADLMDGCVILSGLSNATSLRFRASFGMREECALEAENCPTEQPIKLRQLKILEIKCFKIDERVQRTSKLIFSTLGTSNIKEFNIQTI